MNLVLFEPEEVDRPLPRTDPRAVHLLEILHRQSGDQFDAGLVDGPRGRGTLAAIGTDALTLSFAWGQPPAPLSPIALIVGFPRPQTARDILRDGTSLGVGAMHFVATDRSDPGYARSTLWSSGEWRRQLLIGAAQAFDTRLPEVTWSRSLPAAAGTLSDSTVRIALDHYEASGPLARMTWPVASREMPPVALAIGPERGWSNPERAFLREAGFILVHLGTRVLRTETAVTAAVTLVRAGLGLT